MAVSQSCNSELGVSFSSGPSGLSNAKCGTLGAWYYLGALGNAVLWGARSHNTIKGLVLSILKPCSVDLPLRAIPATTL